MISLTATHLRLTCEALTPLHLGGPRAGSNLRGALGQVMQRAYCVGERDDPQHAACCPTCWLLAATAPGEVRRAYALVPPLASPDLVQSGERFSFGLTLFGIGARFLPYFVLAVPEMGRQGVGPGSGRFALKVITAHDPLTGRWESVLAEGENLVHTPTLSVGASAVEETAEHIAASLRRGLLGLWFLTPTRLTLGGEDRLLAKVPDFGVFFARLIDRLEELEEQFGGGPLAADVPALREQADRVRLVESDVRWVEVHSGSARTGKATYISGFVGQATYHSFHWPSLLPWVAWGQATQVGKDVVKGNGVYEIEAPKDRRYSSWMTDLVATMVEAPS